MKCLEHQVLTLSLKYSRSLIGGSCAFRLAVCRRSSLVICGRCSGCAQPWNPRSGFGAKLREFSDRLLVVCRRGSEVDCGRSSGRAQGTKLREFYDRLLAICWRGSLVPCGRGSGRAQGAKLRAFSDRLLAEFEARQHLGGEASERSDFVNKLVPGHVDEFVRRDHQGTR